MKILLLVVLLVSLVGLASGSIFHFKNKALVPGQEISWRFGLVTPQEQPQISFLYAPDDVGNFSGIASKLVFEQSDEVVKQNGKLHVAVYHSAEGFRVGYDHLGTKHACCTTELREKGKCDLEGELFLNGESYGSSASFKLFPIYLNETKVTFKEDIVIRKTGVYYYFLANCQNIRTSVSGTVLFVNPFGFLGVTQFPSLVFYSLATWIYLFAVAVWFILCVVHYKDMFFLQVFIGVLFLVGFAEMTIWYGEYTFSNQTGLTSMFLVCTAVLTSTIKQTLSRTLVLVTCMGLGIMVAKLENTQRLKITVLTVLYAISSGCFSLFRVLERHEASAQKMTFLFSLVVAMLDVFFYYWTFLSISILLKQLSTRRNKLALAKMFLYKQLWWILIATALFSASLVVGQVVLVSMHKADETWMLLWWLHFALWDLGYFLILLSIGYLFRPMENNQRFAIADGDHELDVLRDSEVAAVPMGVDLILEDAGENVEVEMKND